MKMRVVLYAFHDDSIWLINTYFKPYFLTKEQMRYMYRMYSLNKRVAHIIIPQYRIVSLRRRSGRLARVHRVRDARAGRLRA